MVVGDVYNGRRMLQSLSTLVAGWVVEKFALWSLVGPVAVLLFNLLLAPKSILSL